MLSDQPALSDSKPVDLIPISLVAHYVFCPRRAWLEAAGETNPDSWQMAIGETAHTTTDETRTGRPRALRGVKVRSERLGITGRCDTVEVDEDGRLTVVEYKATPVRRRPEITNPMRVQIILQVEALRDMGFDVIGQAVYFIGHKTRVPVVPGPNDVAAATEAVKVTKNTIEAPLAPQPLEDDPRCASCSHASICMPDERRLTTISRRVVVADPGTEVIHLTTPGARASTREGRLIVRKDEEQIASLPLERAQAVIVHGNVDLSGGLIRELLWRHLPVVWCSSSGRVVGWATSTHSPNGAARVAQHVASAQGHLGLAREFVVAKITNQATLLRRLGTPGETLTRMRAISAMAAKASSLDTLLGLEGRAANEYFSAFTTMFKGPGLAFRDVFISRTRRPALDPINACLNFVYALLLSDCLRAVVACGLDPHAGFLHSSSRNKPALALDLCEEFRAPVADSAVIGAINNGELKPGDFNDTLGFTQLRQDGRRTLIAAYERRVTTKFHHPTFGYEVTWRRAMEVQARLVLGVLDGTQKRYLGVRTR
jgi:CRISPR-associated protein Cas1